MTTIQDGVLVARKIHEIPAHLVGSDLYDAWTYPEFADGPKALFSLHIIPPDEGGERFGYLVQCKREEESAFVHEAVHNCAGEYVDSLECMDISIKPNSDMF